MVAQWFTRDASGDLPTASSITGYDGTVLAWVSWYPESDERARVVVEGDVDRDTAPVLMSYLLDALSRRPVICCDLRRVGFFGAAGVGVLLKARESAAESGGALVLSGVNRAVAYVLRTTGVTGMLPVER